MADPTPISFRPDDDVFFIVSKISGDGKPFASRPKCINHLVRLGWKAYESEQKNSGKSSLMIDYLIGKKTLPEILGLEKHE
jgi:hypothetical protein